MNFFLDFLEQRVDPKPGLAGRVLDRTGARSKTLRAHAKIKMHMKALGSAANGEFSIFTGGQKISDPAETRAQQVARLCGELQTMLPAGMSESQHHAVWLLLTKSATREQPIICRRGRCGWRAKD